MRLLKPLHRRLQRTLRAALIRRLIAWAACSLLLLSFGGALSLLPWKLPILRWSLMLLSFSALPAFLFWPIPEQRLLDRLRSVDEETVFEAYLEAGPGPAKDLLRRLAGERAGALAFAKPGREPLLSGLGGLCLAAILGLGLLEGGSYAARGRLVYPSSEIPAATSGGARIEEEGFSEFASEDPAARMTRRERAMERQMQEAPTGENASLGMPSENGPGISPGRQNRDVGGASPEGSSLKDRLAMRKQGDRPGDESGGAPGAGSGPAPGPSPGSRTGGEERPASGANPVASGEKRDPSKGGAPPMPGQTGQGYEHTGNTGVASPLADYRARFDARYAERTGRNLSASGRMSFGELRDYQRRYFDSFTLQAGVGIPDDPYVAMLKRKWALARGGAW